MEYGEKSGKLLDKDAMFLHILMYWTWKKDKKSVLPDIFYMWKDLSKIEDLINVFGGCTIRIPTKKDLGRYTNEGIAAYLFLVENRRHSTIKKTLEIDDVTYEKLIKPAIIKWKEFFQSNFEHMIDSEEEDTNSDE